MKPIVRFAPSPTGNIHIGNARTALINWLFAKKNEGKFILRFDDTDKARSRQEFSEQIEKDLRWLGIEPDCIKYQSERFPSYKTAADNLRQKGLLYACYETADELERKRKRLLARGLPPVYDRSALDLSEERRKVLEAEGRKPHWRFLLPDFGGHHDARVRNPVSWDDLIRGRQTIDLASMSDPVLIREDGSYLYTLPSVVDDIEMGVTHVIRGDDHVTNTAAQIALFEALGEKSPDFCHHNLLISANGEGFSKRMGSLSIDSLNKSGFEPMAVVSLSVLTGSSVGVEVFSRMNELVQIFSPAIITRSPARFDLSELEILNRKLVREMSYDEVDERLKEAGIDDGEKFWSVVRENIGKVCEVAEWWEILERAVPVIAPEDVEFLQQAKRVLPLQPWSSETWKNWIDDIGKQTGRKGKALFMPLRKALTGRESGPELALILLLIGRDKTMERLP